MGATQLTKEQQKVRGTEGRRSGEAVLGKPWRIDHFQGDVFKQGTMIFQCGQFLFFFNVFFCRIQWISKTKLGSFIFFRMD